MTDSVYTKQELKERLVALSEELELQKSRFAQLAAKMGVELVDGLGTTPLSPAELRELEAYFDAELAESVVPVLSPTAIPKGLWA